MENGFSRPRTFQIKYINQTMKKKQKKNTNEMYNKATYQRVSNAQINHKSEKKGSQQDNRLSDANGKPVAKVNRMRKLENNTLPNTTN